MEKIIFLKYRAINKYLFDSLSNSTLYFSSREKLNDPFDCNINLQKAIESAIIKLSEEDSQNLQNFLSQGHIVEKFQNNIGKLGVCSFTLESQNTLMWSHYAGNHTGICLAYEFPMEFLQDGDVFFGVDAIKYKDDGLTDWLVENHGLYKTNNDYFFATLLTVFLTAKSPSWKYEGEARIIRNEQGPFQIPKEYLKQIYFGLNTKEEDKKTIFKIVNEAYDHKVTYCQIERTDKDFGIKSKKI